MLNRNVSRLRSQKGFTLIELLIAVTITSIIGIAIAATITQLFTVSISDNNRMDAVKQVENALHYINRDVQMARPGSIQNGTAVPLNSNPLTLSWTNYAEALDYEVVYSLNGTELKRQAEATTRDIPPITVSSNITHIASNINLDPALTQFSFDGAVFTITLTSSVEGLRSATESRTLQVKPRIN